MLHREFPVNITKETICAYFWAGIAVGVLSFQSSKGWAFSVIEQLDAPLIEVIDIATANDRNNVLDALRVSTQGADQQIAGHFLLADIHTQLKAGDISALAAVRAAMRVAQVTSLPNHVYYDFDRLDNDLHFAANDTYGTAAEVSANILQTLAEHADAT